MYMPADDVICDTISIHIILSTLEYSLVLLSTPHARESHHPTWQGMFLATALMAFVPLVVKSRPTSRLIAKTETKNKTALAHNVLSALLE